jgi:hypothetical protein
MLTKKWIDRPKCKVVPVPVKTTLHENTLGESIDFAAHVLKLATRWK